ncbi:hypothetical protein C8R44DRAFT_804471, partial [Mycena epipterygia]
TTANTNAVVPSKQVCKQREDKKICDCGCSHCHGIRRSYDCNPVQQSRIQIRLGVQILF